MSNIDAVRRFNRFYTKQIGVLEETLVGSQFSLTQVRILYELAHSENPTAADIAKRLGLDAGYLSRILTDFESRKLIAKSASKIDARQSLLRLTPKGRAAFEPLEKRAQTQVGAMLQHLSNADQSRLIAAMQTIETLLSGQANDRVPYILRTHQSGDMGWIVHRHGALYAQEYGFNEEFEALVAEIAAKFLREFNPKTERCWIAERDGEIVGSVCLVHQSDDVAKLRLLLVEPQARGLGIGKRLVDECIRFARQAGYRRITLWTNDVLIAARRIYENAGFNLVKEERRRTFGRNSATQDWSLTL